MRISDWSSDVCSSDLIGVGRSHANAGGGRHELSEGAELPPAETAMKIVDVCAFYAPHGGGVKTYIDRKLEIGSALGHEIVVIAPGSHACVERRSGGGRIIFVESPPLIDRKSTRLNSSH